MAKDAGGLARYEKACPVCGKTFVCLDADSWVYKRSGRFMCSYPCWRKHEAARKRHTGKQPALTLEVNGVTRTLSEWAKLTGLKRQIIYQRAQVLGWTGAACLAAVNSKSTKIRERTGEEI